MPKVEKRGSRWRIRYYGPDGNRLSKSFDTAREAHDWYARERTAMTEGKWVNPSRGNRFFDDWAADVFAALAPVRRPNTIALNDRLYRLYVKPRWGEIKLGRIRKDDVKGWLVGMATLDLSPATVQKVYNTFRTVVQAAIDEGMITSPLPKDPPLARVEPKPERYLTDAEIKHLAGFFRPEYVALVYVCCYGGLRIGEAAALQLRDVDWSRNGVRVDEGQTEVDDVICYETPKTRAGNRFVPVADAAVAELQSHVARFVGADPNERLFKSPTGDVFRIRTWRRREWYPAVEKSGIERLTPHDMRHTAASIFISEGASPWMVASLLGHNDTRMVDKVYGHLFDSDREALRQRISARARQTPPE